MNIHYNWLQYLAKLHNCEMQALKLAQNGTEILSRLPSFADLAELQRECLDLTELWHGHGNCSAFFASFLRMCDNAQVSSYKYSDLPILYSNDGYLIIFDRGFRNNFIQPCSNPFTNDELNKRRYLSFTWLRSFDLSVITNDGKELIIRSSGTQELSKLCINAIPYQPQHGLGLAEYADNSVCDIEKIAREVQYLNVPVNAQLLSGEQRFNVGQNSHLGSSVPSLSHTHQSAETIEQFKIYNHAPSQIFNIPSIGGALTITQVGILADAYYIKFVSDSVTDPDYLRFFLGLRLHLEKSFGRDRIDMYFHIIPDNNGRFVSIFVPFVKLQRADTQGYPPVFINPETGKNNVELQVAEHLHLGNGSKSWGIRFDNRDFLDLCLGAGAERLAALYDFAAKSGSREVVRGYIRGFSSE